MHVLRNLDLFELIFKFGLAISAQPDGFFDLSVFWQSSLPQLRDKLTLPDPTVRIKELLFRVTTKEYTSRALSSIKVDLFGKKFAVKVFRCSFFSVHNGFSL